MYIRSEHWISAVAAFYCTVCSKKFIFFKALLKKTHIEKVKDNDTLNFSLEVLFFHFLLCLTHFSFGTILLKMYVNVHH